jgi:hypothetical protein
MVGVTNSGRSLCLRDLEQRPALLLRMNAPRGLDQVSFDSATREVRFPLPETGAADGLRIAVR